MNQSIFLTLLGASPVAELASKLDVCWDEVLQQIRELAGSFFGWRPDANNDVRVRTAIAGTRA
jgi:hypothetical protein